MKKDLHMKINKEWHLHNPMPKNPSLEERIHWHLSHAKACKCREMPESIAKEIRKRKIKL
jgi:alpha-amylase/alpha-mannosidase (GH57 family)